MRTNKVFFIFLPLFISGISAIAQTHTDEIIQRTSGKIQAIQRDYRVVEKTISDMITSGDTVGANRIFFYHFYTARRYHLNAFASDQDISDISIAILAKDVNDKYQVVSRTQGSGTDVSLNFNPQETKQYVVYITGTLRANIQSAFFNLIIDRD